MGAQIKLRDSAKRSPAIDIDISIISKEQYGLLTNPDILLSYSIHQ